LLAGREGRDGHARDVRALGRIGGFGLIAFRLAGERAPERGGVGGAEAHRHCGEEDGEEAAEGRGPHLRFGNLQRGERRRDDGEHDFASNAAEAGGHVPRARRRPFGEAAGGEEDGAERPDPGGGITLADVEGAAHAADHQRKADEDRAPAEALHHQVAEGGADMAEHVSGRNFGDEVGGRIAHAGDRHVEAGVGGRVGRARPADEHAGGKCGEPAEEAGEGA
jgi:hypothetical protein